MARRVVEQPRRLVAEAGGWLRLEQPRPELDGVPPGDLLRMAEDLAGNLRYAIHEGRVWLVGEIRTPDAGMFFEQASQRLQALTGAGPTGGGLEESLIDASLDAGGWASARRDGDWVVPPSPGRPQEIRVRAEPSGVRVEAVLASWTEISSETRAALAQFLCASQFGLRFCRAAVDDTSARIVSRVEDPEFAEVELLDSLGSVDAASRLLTREPPALLCGELTASYMEMARGGRRGAERSHACNVQPAAKGRCHS